MTDPGSTAAGTFVLIHGAFHGGWCWQRVQPALERRGHRVYAPSQTGLGDRRHLMSAHITMETFVDDIANLILFEDLRDVILVGHSFGTRTVIGVADRMPERLRHLVFLDGGFPIQGRSRLDTMPAEVREARLTRAMDYDGGISVPPPPGASFGLTNPDDAAWVERYLTPHPLSVDASVQTLSHELGNGVPATYVRFVEPTFEQVGSSAEYARNRSDWQYLEIAGGHDAIVSNSSAVSGCLEAIAAGRGSDPER